MEAHLVAGRSCGMPLPRLPRPNFFDGVQRGEMKMSRCRDSGLNRLPRGVGAAYVLYPWGCPLRYRVFEACSVSLGSFSDLGS